jgi:chromate transport protein ChrA
MSLGARLGVFLALLAGVAAGMWLLWDTVLVRNTSVAAAWLAGLAPFITAGAAAVLLVAGLKLFGKAQSE